MNHKTKRPVWAICQTGIIRKIPCLRACGRELPAQGFVSNGPETWGQQLRWTQLSTSLQTLKSPGMPGLVSVLMGEPNGSKR